MRALPLSLLSGGEKISGCNPPPTGKGSVPHNWHPKDGRHLGRPRNWGAAWPQVTHADTQRTGGVRGGFGPENHISLIPIQSWPREPSPWL